MKEEDIDDEVVQAETPLPPSPPSHAQASGSISIKPKEKTAVSAKRPTKKKPKDKPKRPLSAYNFFFKEEREKILRVVLSEDAEKVENDPNSEDYLDDDALSRLKKEGGKVSFEEMGKIIGMRWKNIDTDRLAKFSELATQDTERYKEEMQSYNGRQEAKMRSEALKPPVAYGRADIPKNDNTRSAMGVYPDQGMSYSTQGGPVGMVPGMGSGYSPYAGGGMEFGGYPGMGMGGMYGPYGYSMGGPDMSQMQGGGMDSGGHYSRGGGMYGMMGGSGGFQGSMMGYGGQGSYDQTGMMDPSGQGGMYGGYGGQGWGHQ